MALPFTTCYLKQLLVIVAGAAGILGLFMAGKSARACFAALAVTFVLALLVAPPSPRVQWGNFVPTCYKSEEGLTIEGFLDPPCAAQVDIVARVTTRIDWVYVGIADVLSNGRIRASVNLEYVKTPLHTGDRFTIAQLNDGQHHTQGWSLGRIDDGYLGGKLLVAVPNLCPDAANRPAPPNGGR